MVMGVEISISVIWGRKSTLVILMHESIISEARRRLRSRYSSSCTDSKGFEGTSAVMESWV